jgi:hypothetical protein
METKNKPIPAREMHKIVWVSVGVLTLFFMTFPIAMWRVSQKEKFRGFHVKSLTIQGQSLVNAVANAVAKGLAQAAIASSNALPAANNSSLAVDSKKSCLTSLQRLYLSLIPLLKRLLRVALQIRLSKLYLYQQASRKFRRWIEQIRQQKLPIA